MEYGSEVKPSTSKISVEDGEYEDAGPSALNPTIINYYKKFGRKRDLEQYFSLSTVQGEVSDPSSLFWRKLKMSDSDGEKKSESPVEICKISITCTQPDHDSSMEEILKLQESESPPIVIEEVAPHIMQPTDVDSVKSDDNNSQKSLDRTLDTSMNKPNSPTSSITSQRKLEWDSLADVGYANEADRRNSASSLSTLERLALQQQYSNSDPQINIGLPTAQSTPQDEVDNRSKIKSSKTKKIHRKDIDIVEVKTSEHNPSQTLNVNLTKHISFNVDKDGQITVGSSQNNVSFKDKMTDNQFEKKDKEIQTTLQEHISERELRQSKQFPLYENPIPVLIKVNPIRKRRRMNRLKSQRKKITKKNLSSEKVNRTLEKSGDQVSAAESFEYMPGDVYNQNQCRNSLPSTSNAAGNKSSLESSRGATTTDSSKESKNSFTADLEKNLNLLKVTLHKHFANYEFKKALIKNIVQDFMKTSYQEDTTTDFLSGLSFSSKRLGLSHNSTSTSDTGEKISKPKKSILRESRQQDSASQSVPDLRSIPKNNKSIQNIVTKKKETSTSETDASKKPKSEIDNSKLTSAELYRQYIEALQREKARKKYLKDKELFLRQKLSKSANAIKMPPNIDQKVESKLKSLMNDLIRNNYNDGSGDASKVESGSEYPLAIDKSARDQKSRSIFTLSSSNSDCDGQSSLQNNNVDNSIVLHQGHLTSHYCCCPYHFDNVPKVPLQVENVSSDDKKMMTNNVVKSQFNAPDHSSKLNQTVNNNDSLPCSFKESLKKCSCLKDKPLQLQELYFKKHFSGTKVVHQPKEILPSRSVKPNGNVMASEAKFKNISEKTCQTNTKLIVAESLDKPTVPFICKATRAIQTDMSINPQRMEPTLNDIKIINEAESVILINGNSVPITKNRKFKNEPRGILSEYVFTDENRVVPEQRIEIDSSLNVEVADTIQFAAETNISKMIGVEKYSKGVQSDNISICKGTHTLVVDDFENGNQLQYEMDRLSTVSNDKLGSNQEIDKSLPVSDDKFGYNQDIYSNKKEPLEQDINIQDDKNQETKLKTDQAEALKNSEREYQSVSDRSSSDGRNSKSSEGFIACSESKLSTTTRIIRRSNTDTENILDENNDFKQSNSLPVKRSGSSMSVTTIFYKNSANNMSSSEKIIKSNLDSDKQNQDIDKNIPEFGSVASIEHSLKYNSNDKRTLSKDSNDSKEVLSIIQDVTKRYTKKNIRKIQRKKCLSEVIKLLTYLLDTEDPETKNVTDDSKISMSSSSESVKAFKNSLTNSPKSNTQKPNQNNNKTKCKTVTNELDSDNTESKKYKEIQLNERPAIYQIKNKNTETRDVFCNTESTKDNLQHANGIEKTRVVPCPTENTHDISDKSNGNITRSKSAVDKCIQMSSKKGHNRCTESSDTPISSELPCTSSDTATCKILHKIKKECENFHRRRCLRHGTKRCECSSSTSAKCELCSCIHYCYCRKYRGHRGSHKEEPDAEVKSCVAYNLILKSSDSMSVDDSVCNKNNNPLKNIIIKVPKKKGLSKLPFKEVTSKIENKISDSPRNNVLPNPKDSFFEKYKLNNENLTETYSLRDYLEKNKPNFVAQSIRRQESLKLNNQKRATLRASQREVLSMQLQTKPSLLNEIDEAEVRRLLQPLIVDSPRRRRNGEHKLISEREMKKRSENIYKTLPEVTKKKEDAKKESIKKTNLLLAYIFKKNLQRKVLDGSVNISYYTNLIKI